MIMNRIRFAAMAVAKTIPMNDVCDLLVRSAQVRDLVESVIQSTSGPTVCIQR
jgi:hypothetical protein